MPVMRFPASGPAGVMLLLGAAAGCAGGERPAAVTAVVPTEGYNDSAIDIAVQGGPFRPSYTIDTGSGHGSIDLGAFSAFISPSPSPSPSPSGASNGVRQVAVASLTWRSQTELAGTLPASLPAGSYDLTVRDPRGQMVVLPNAFTSLGPDLQRPTVSVIQPADGSLVASETQVPVMLQAGDGLGHLMSVSWNVSSLSFGQSGACALEGNPAQKTCGFSFLAPQLTTLTDMLILKADAVDTAGNSAVTAAIQIRVALPPQLSSFSPMSGMTRGGTVLTVIGDDFVPGTQVLIGGVVLNLTGGVPDSTTTIHRATPPHDPGSFPLVVRTGSAEVTGMSFLFVAPPVLRAVSPAGGPSQGGNAVAVVGDHFRYGETRILFGTSIDAGVPLQGAQPMSENRIDGFAPPGTGVVSIFASDPIGGDVELPRAYTYVSGVGDGGVPDGGGP
jgi:hypothetical protein